MRGDLGREKEGGRKTTVTFLPRHLHQPTSSKSGLVIYCRFNNETGTSHRWQQAVQTTLTLIKATWWLDLIQCPLTSTHCYRGSELSFRGILIKTTARQISTLVAHRRLGKQTQRCRGIQSAEWRCNLSSKVSTLFLPVLFPAVRDGPLAFKKEGGGETSKGKKAAVPALP